MWPLFADLGAHQTHRECSWEPHLKAGSWGPRALLLKESEPTHDEFFYSEYRGWETRDQIIKAGDNNREATMCRVIY